MEVRPDASSVRLSMMPRSVAVSRAEVASSQMSSFGDLRHTQMQGPDVSMSRSHLPGRPRWFPWFERGDFIGVGLQNTGVDSGEWHLTCHLKTNRQLLDATFDQSLSTAEPEEGMRNGYLQFPCGRPSRCCIHRTQWPYVSIKARRGGGGSAGSNLGSGCFPVSPEFQVG